MGQRIIPLDRKIEKMTLEVMKNARTQVYTPETLCDLQKITEAQYYYWWCMDMKKEEWAIELFTDDFSYYCFGPAKVDAYLQCFRSKFVNQDLCTMHMGHQPLIWIQSPTQARGIFQYEDHHNYVDDGTLVRGWCIYVNDFVKDDKGLWHIKNLRLAYKKMEGEFRATIPPADWKPKHWDV